MTIQIKRSSTPGNVPTLSAGQLAINDADGLLFWLDSGSVVKSCSLNDIYLGSDITRGLAKFVAICDCRNPYVGGQEDGFYYVNNGTGALWSQWTTMADNEIGIARLVSGTVATNRGSIIGGDFNTIRFSQGAARFVSRVKVLNPSNASTTYTLRHGFLDSETAEPTDGVYFRYTHGTNGGRWQAVTRNNGTETGSATDTGITPDSNWHKYQIDVNAAGNSVVFKIDGTTVATNTTNIPTGSGRLTGYGLSWIRSVGTASINMIDVDYLAVEQLLTTSR